MSERDPRQDPKTGDVLEIDGRRMTINGVGAQPRRKGVTVRYTCSQAGSGCECGLNAFRRLYRKAAVVAVAASN